MLNFSGRPKLNLILFLLHLCTKRVLLLVDSGPNLHGRPEGGSERGTGPEGELGGRVVIGVSMIVWSAAWLVVWVCPTAQSTTVLRSPHVRASHLRASHLQDEIVTRVEERIAAWTFLPKGALHLSSR